MNSTDISLKHPKDVTLQLLDYSQKNDWAGYDPYDALNSKLFNLLPFLDFRLFRLGFSQVLKRVPFNIRPVLMIPKLQNPKAIAVFLMALLKLSKLGLLDGAPLIKQMMDKLYALRSPNKPFWCWGYSFPWQTRTVLVPRGAPNLVCTTFVANALLDAFDSTGDFRSLHVATGAAEYILNELFWEDGDSTAGFSYPVPGNRSRVHNANFLGAALLCRLFKLTGESKFLYPALKVARYSASRQEEDGSWAYGELSTQQWVDNFHTGYNLCALREISRYAGISEFDSHIQRGFGYYLEQFFTADFAPKYFHNKTYPIDSHCVAQSIITLLTFRDIYSCNVNVALSVFRWAMKHLWSEQGFFYYQVTPHYTNRISFIRWTQAWMLLAITTILQARGDTFHAI